MHRLLATVSLVVLASTAFAQDTPFAAPGEGTEYSPYPEQTIPNQVLFGDTHLHTSYSADAGLVGATLTPDDAYRYAKGETVVSNTGIRARISRPLDFLVVADHAENLGLPAAIAARDPVLMENAWGAEMVEAAAPRTIDSMIATYENWMGRLFAKDDPLAGTPFAATMWSRATEAAERHNVPGAFSALIGFEWTSQPGGNNLHRVVVFRDGKGLADRIVPISTYDTDDPERLWDWMEQYEADTGGRILAIPHNGNLSNGLMFDDVTLTTRQPLDATYAERRSRLEPVYEVTQAKGDGETHPMLSPEDEFADFVTWDKGSFGSKPKTPDMLPREYAREALKRGLAYEASLGINPFKFGMLGSTDSHTGLSGPTEDNYFGKVAAVEPTADPIRLYEAITGRFAEDDADKIFHWQTAASGLTAVWARENTREAIFDALQRREVYATTGSRIRVRVFAGYGFEESDLPRSDFAAHGYTNGVPMGGDLAPAPERIAPRLLIRALRDPDGANLDRVQVVKGWQEVDGTLGERVYDVAWSDDRMPGTDGRLPDVGNTVNAEEATYSNTIGAPILAAYWSDPDFDPAERAFYYVRVIEIPTPRWTTFDAKFFGVEIPEGAETWITERAYTSPIWYTPEN